LLREPEKFRFGHISMTTPPTIQGSPESRPRRGAGPAQTVFVTVFLITMIMATAVTFILPESYASTARVRVQVPAASAGPYTIQTEVEVIQSEVVLSNAVKKLNLNEVWGKKYFAGETLKTAESMKIIKDRLNVAPVRNSELLTITVYSDDRREAATIANTLAGEYQNYYSEPPKTGTVNPVITITDSAVPADRPCKPNKPLNLALGAVAGVVLGAAAAWLVGVLNRQNR